MAKKYTSKVFGDKKTGYQFIAAANPDRAIFGATIRRRTWLGATGKRILTELRYRKWLGWRIK